MTMKCTYSSAELQCSVPRVRRYTRVPRGLKDVKLRQQIICNPRFEQDVKLVRLWLYSNSYYFFNF